MRRLIGPLIAAPFVVVLAFGAVAGDDPLIRVACRLSLISGAAALVVPRLTQPTRVWRIRNWLLGIMGVSFAALFVVTQTLGGGAVNGRVTVAGDHYLTEHGRETKVSRSVYYWVAAVEILVFVSWTAGFVLMPIADSLAKPETEGPPKDELQRTRPAQAMEPRR